MTDKLHAPDAGFADRVRLDEEKQAFLRFIGAKITRVEPGFVEYSLPYKEELSQQHGFLHAGVITTIADVAAGYAAYSLMPAGSEVLSVEFKVNLLRPAVGESFVARGRVVNSGRTLTVVQGDVYAISNGVEKHVACLQGTMICRRHKPQ